MGAQSGSVAIHDVAGLTMNALPHEERAVVVAAEEAGLLALRAASRGEAGGDRVFPGLCLRLSAEREAHALEQRRIDRGEHVGLILLGICRPAHEADAVALDHPRVVPRPQLARARP